MYMRSSTDNTTSSIVTSTTSSPRYYSGAVLKQSTPLPSLTTINMNSSNQINRNIQSTTMSRIGTSIKQYQLHLGLVIIVAALLFIDGFAVVSHYNRLLSEESKDAETISTRQLLSIESLLQEFRSATTTTTTTTNTNNNNDVDVSTTSDSEPKIVWLMSFPNSGTAYTSQLIRDVSQTDSASNYADETLDGQKGILDPIYTDQPMGPFWIKPDDTSDVEYVAPTKYVVTKTHCGMRCTMCPPEKYSESSYSFRRRCLTTKWIEVQSDGSYVRIFGEYPSTHVAKAIHLIRNPFDNVVSRFHLDREVPGKIASNYARDRAGFREYCREIDSLYVYNEDRINFLHEDLLNVLRIVPCHDDFIRYIEWHNLAFNTADDLNIPTYVVRYEWYSTRFDATVKELLEFLELPQKGYVEPFASSGSLYKYSDYFTSEEKAALKQAYKTMTTTRTWVHLAHYFEDSTDSVKSGITEDKV